MSSRLVLSDPARPALCEVERPVARARLAHHRTPLEPPEVMELAADDPVELVEDLYAETARRTALPPLAVREVVENLVHAGFREALVSVLDDGGRVRVSDAGPGVRDVERALEPGYTSAGVEERRALRGVGGGLPLAAALMGAVGGRLEIAPNLGAGTVVTLIGAQTTAAGLAEPAPSEAARTILALLLELGEADPARLAGELGCPVGSCGRELVLLEQRGLVVLVVGGARRLTEAGVGLVASLF